MRRLVYLCPECNVPVGGIKVIYRQVEALGRLGVPAFVLHPADPGFRCDWFTHDARFLDSAVLNATRDFVVIPEVWALEFGLRCQAANVPYALFVQNGYSLYPNDDAAASPLRSVAAQAAIILSISADTDQMIQLNLPGIDPARLARVQFSVAGCFAAGRGDADRTITFMPRKMAPHAARVVYALRNHLPQSWRIQPIDNVDEATCAALLKASRIFLSFSEFEGLPLPPLEAALAGNFVVGYTGQGGRENWTAPNFEPIEPGNILAFVAAVRSAVVRMESGTFGRDVLRPGMTRLADRFSPESEARSLRVLAVRIAALS